MQGLKMACRGTHIQLFEYLGGLSAIHVLFAIGHIIELTLKARMLSRLFQKSCDFNQNVTENLAYLFVNK